MNDPTLLTHDHSKLDALLAETFSALAAGVAERSHAAVDVFWARLAMHIRAEHLHLFPTVLGAIETAAQEKVARGGPSLEMATSTVAQLQEDHDYFMRELAAAVKELRAVCNHERQDKTAALREVEGKILAVSRRLQRHNELEESQIYLWAVALLAPPEQAALNGKIGCELANPPPRLREDIGSSARLGQDEGDVQGR